MTQNNVNLEQYSNELATNAKNASKKIRTLSAEKRAAVLNRVPYPDKLGALDLGDLELACVIGPDELLMENDVEGKSVFELPADAAILKGAKEALQKLEILK